ncbi:MAG: phage tail tip lysozyme, partial [Culicoidibacterales bacterium]
MKKKLVFLMFVFICFGVTQTGVNIEATGSWWNSDLETSNACRYLIENLGYSKYAAAGILGNFRHESNINPYVRERIGDHNTYSLGKEKADKLDPDNNGFGPGWGLAQWGDGSGLGGLGSGRWIQLINYVNSKTGKHYTATFNDSFKNGVFSNESSLRGNIPNLYEQLDFVKYEMSPTSAYVSQIELNAMNSLEETSDAVLYRYEKSSTKSQEKRRQNTRDIYQYNCNGIGSYNVKIANVGYIDELVVAENKLKVRGWHATELATDKTPRYMFVMNAVTGKEIKRLPITNSIRNDVLGVYPYLLSAKTSGFNVEIPITDDMKGESVFVVTRYLNGNDSNNSLSDKWFTQNQIMIPNHQQIEKTNIPSISYQAHVQSIGWQDCVKDGVLAGTAGRGLRIESFRMKVSNLPVSGDINYATHVQNIGWQAPRSSNQISGTTGQSLRMEAMHINLTGELEKQYDVYYRTHIENFGWLGWSKNGENAGSEGRGLRMEAIEVRLVKKGDTSIKTGNGFVGKPNNPSVNYSAHVQNIGWQNYVNDGQVAGTFGRGLRVESFRMNLSNLPVSGDISYAT